MTTKAQTERTDLPRFVKTTDPTRNDAYCIPGDHRIRDAKTGLCGWCGNSLKVPNKAQTERAEAIAKLREIIPSGSTVWTVLRHTSRSNMGSSISPVCIGSDGPRDLSYLVVRALGLRFDRENGGVKVGYMGERRDHALIHELARTLYGDGRALNQVEL